ncbi:flagellar hook-length control protein FliK [Paenibacillus humicola]|uniref:flagellar hook-length control protein FliK n=1 Tax=Paenibacillus humicola TaxID=3110540 RepID=UPI00237C1642|nr:flagellar hook-length control protein FliK [Paenibacillus humicola]
MPMTISQSASPAVSQPASAAGQAAKPEGGNAFGQALVQTISGTAGAGAGAGGANGRAEIRQAAEGTAANVKTEGLANPLLAGNASSADLLAVIDKLLQKLETADAKEDTQQKRQQDDLSAAWVQMDQLLSLLGLAPILQPMPESDQAEASGGDSELPLGLPAGPNGAAGMSAALNALVLQQAQALTAGASTQEAQPEPLSAARPQPEIAVLKAGLQEALADLKTFVQDSKGTAAGRSAYAAIAQQLVSASELLDGGGEAGRTAASLPDAVQAAFQQAAQSPHTGQAASAHLQKLGSRPLTAGLLAVVQDREKETPEQRLSMTERPGSAHPEPALQPGGGIQEPLKAILPTRLPAAQPVPAQQFAQSMQELIVRQFTVSGGANGVHEARISLFPEQLGQVDVRIALHNGQLTAHFVTDTAAAKDALEAQMMQLRSALQTQGIQIDRLDVTQNQVQQGLFQDRQGQPGREQQHAKRNKPKDDAAEGVSAFDADMERLEAQQAAHRDLGLGRSLHTTV